MIEVHTLIIFMSEGIVNTYQARRIFLDAQSTSPLMIC